MLLFFFRCAGAAFDYAVMGVGQPGWCPRSNCSQTGSTSLPDILAVLLGLDRDFQLVAAVDPSPAGETGADITDAVLVPLLDLVGPFSVYRVHNTSTILDITLKNRRYVSEFL